MNLVVWNIPEASTEQEVRDFLEAELGRLAKKILVYELGTSNAYAQVEVDADVPYVGDMIARALQGKHLGGVALQVSASLFGEEGKPPPRPAE
jgi:hypothetical protein